ncbi:hypothetical protein H257_15185 [Aphanomyces astaci]|uniref:Uncharacterized protein n=1 Tax=Aphanomyces astaci TaxID=112090 RepID=W4FNH8_APHAT|nr:hypothetical protein H257_15185 [Aphanomyces astaci]ETV69037.1 hypothetical protein H257_15185 [Aphanomyces astaci]|eukprot:XP_009841496.1 hypothetical protein H257_15185 [Aphanomyces astaci]
MLGAWTSAFNALYKRIYPSRSCATISSSTSFSASVASTSTCTVPLVSRLLNVVARSRLAEGELEYRLPTVTLDVFSWDTPLDVMARITDGCSGSPNRIVWLVRNH